MEADILAKNNLMNSLVNRGCILKQSQHVSKALMEL